MGNYLPDFCGLDLGNSKFRVVELKNPGSSNVVISGIGRVDTPEEGIFPKTDTAKNKVSETIRQVLKDGKVKTKNVVLSLPEDKVFTRLIQMPHVDEKTLEESIFWEAKQYVPLALDEVKLDWVYVSEGAGEGGYRIINVLLVAVPKKIVEDFVLLIDRAELNLLAVETQSIALARATKRLVGTVKESYMIADIGAKGTVLTVGNNGQVIFSQTAAVGSIAISQAIAAEFNLNALQADQYKAAYGLDASQAEGKIAATVTPIIDLLINEMKKTIDFFKSQNNATIPTKLFLVGDGALLPNLLPYLTEKLNLDISVLDPFLNLRVENRILDNFKEKSSPGFAVSLGLAMKTE